MITYINKANADKYRVLFSNAVKALQTHDGSGKPVGSQGAGDPVISTKDEFKEVTLTAEEFAGGDYYIWDEASSSWAETPLDAEFDSTAKYAIKISADTAISTLEEYFSYIVELTAINKKYTILPLDEDFLEINANTRTITVPNSFKSNGISVQGDEVAEVLYFKINRFFDMDDLATKKIFIQWKAPKDEEGNQEQGVSVPWVIDTETVPGYIVFGWPLASELTRIPGKIEFAVRFYDYNEDENKIIYSFSTLTASADIKPALNYKIDEMLLDGTGIIDSEDLIINRLVNSEIYDPNMPDPLDPTIIDNVISCFDYDEQMSEDGKRKIYNIYLTNPENGTEADGYYRTQATSEDSGIISYTWIKKDSEGDLAQNSLTSSIVFIEVDDTVTDPNKIYYQKTDEDVYTAFVFTEECPDLESAKLLGYTLYERMSQATLNSTGEDVIGSYQARITNRVGRKTTRVYGDIALVQGPVPPEITKDITKDNAGVFNAEDNTLTIEVTADTDEHSYVSYVWQRSDSKNGAYTNLATNSSNKYIIAGADYGADDDGDGFYRVVVETKLNSVVKNVTGEALRITHSASPVTIEVPVGTLPNGGYNINNPLSVTVTPNANEKRTDEDYLEYQWYRYAGSGNQLAEDFNSAALGEYQVKDDIIISGANAASVKIENTAANENGYYFCQVTNHYNGTTSVKCSPFFNVVDTRVEI